MTTARTRTDLQRYLPGLIAGSVVEIVDDELLEHTLHGRQYAKRCCWIDPDGKSHLIALLPISLDVLGEEE